jgi:ATP-binding cassette subfamily F protein 3
VIWLEEFLRRQNLPMLVVSHDREFLDKVCNKIVDVEEGVTVSYSGNYSKYLEQRKARMAQWREKYERQQRYIKEEESYIRRAHGDPALVQVAKSREAALEKLRAGEDFIRPPPRDRKFRFRFPPAPRCGESVIEGSGLGHGYGEGKYKVLFRDVDLQVERGDRIGFIGPNGAGGC